jgi:hypothetical protein
MHLYDPADRARSLRKSLSAKNEQDARGNKKKAEQTMI